MAVWQILENMGKIRIVNKQGQEIAIRKIPKRGARCGVEHHKWKGDKVGYASLHIWIRKHLAKPEFCENCKTKPPYEVANISGKYLRDLTDWRWSCRKCHMLSDGRMKNLILRRGPGGRRKQKQSKEAEK